jgi:ATP-dependent 26S proteasome regulatory subunit
VAQLADTLFRYFVIQYRNGRIDSTIERPNHYHVEQLRSIFNICTKSTIANDNINPNSAMIMKRLHHNIDEYVYLLHHKIR